MTLDLDHNWMETHLESIVLKSGKGWAIFLGEVAYPDAQTETDTGRPVIVIAMS